jgi:predicted Zn-dependent peptidase
MSTPTESFSQVPALSTERAVIWPSRTHKQLANGLEFMLVESHTIPKFTGQLFFRGGNSIGAVPGLADLTSAVVRTGTAKRSSREIEEDLRRLGADLSTGTSADNSSVAFAGLVEYSNQLLHLTAELAREASFPADEFERERRQMLEGLKIERATPGFLATERLRKVLFGNHPYGLFSPSEEQVENYRLVELRDYYQKQYRPGSALLVMAGDFSSNEMAAQIERVFGDWPASRAEVGPNPELPAIRGRRVYLVHVPGAVQANIVVGNRAITRQSPDWLSYSLANSIYGGAFNSRLVMNIREEKGYTYSPRSSVHGLRQHGYFSIHAAVRNEVVAATLKEIFYEVDRMRSDAVGEAELADARNYMSGVFSLGLATQGGLAGQLAVVALERLPDNYLENYRATILALTSADVLDAAQKYFDSANAQIVVVGDRAAIEAQAAEYGPLEVYDTQGNRI